MSTKGVKCLHITTIVNGKGGVGKTTTTHALGTGLDKKKYNPLVIDYDPQGNLSLAYGLHLKECPTMYHVFTKEVDITEAIQRTYQGDIIAGNTSLAQVEVLYAGDKMFEGAYALQEALEKIKENYTHIFIDNQPLVTGFLTRQALVTTNDILIPVTADTFTLHGLSTLYEAYKTIKQRVNPELAINGLLLTRHNPRTILSTNITENLKALADNLGTKVYKAFIREGIAIKEAQAKKKSLFDYAPNSKPAKDYNAFIKEYLGEG